MLTPGTSAPVASAAVPVTVAFTCASAGIVTKKHRKTASLFMWIPPVFDMSVASWADHITSWKDTQGIEVPFLRLFPRQIWWPVASRIESAPVIIVGRSFAAVFFFTVVVGCAFKREPPPTFAEAIAPIIHRNCSVCHRPGEAGPFP